MRVPSRVAGLILLAVVVPASWSAAQGPRADGPMTEDGISRLVTTLKIKPEAVAGMVRARGVGFAADEPALERLRKAGIPDVVVDAVREAGQKAEAAKVAVGTDPAVTYEDVAEMLRLQVPEDAIRERIKGTVFTLGKDQVAALKALGATDALVGLLGAARTIDPAREIANLAILLDCSGSMSEPTPDGATKMDAARRAAIELIRKAPAGLHLAFVVYGHDKALRCEAVKVVRPLGPIDAAGKEDLIRQVAAMAAAGSTPIELALHTAGQELASAQGPSGVVLISDGKEMCGGNPTSEAAALARRLKLGFGVQVVGFGVRPDEKSSLQEIAQAGKGNYYDAPTTAKLQDVALMLARAVETGRKPIVEESGIAPRPRTAAPAPAMTARVRVLCAQLRDPAHETRKTAAQSLERLGNEALPAVPALVDRVADDFWVNFYDENSSKDAAVKALERLAPEQIADALLKASKSETVGVRRWAAEQFGALPRPSGGNGAPSSPKLAAATAAGLSRRVSGAVAALKDEDHVVRGNAASSLEALGSAARSAVPALVECIADDYWVKFYDDGKNKDKAVLALKKLAPNEVEGALTRAAASSNEWVRNWATRKLVE